MKAESSGHAKKVKSVAGAAAILRHLADLSGPAGVNAIARNIGLSPSSCFNILKTLAAESLVTFDDATKGYTLGPALVRLAQRALAFQGVVPTIRPLLDQFARRGLATAIWEVTGGTRLILSAFIESDAATRIHMTVGQRLPVLAGAMGRCIAASGRLSHEEIERLFAEVRWERRPAFETYLKQVELAAKQGWAMDEGCFMRGITTIAAPVSDGQDVRICISNSMFSGKTSPAQLQDLGAASAHAAKRASTLLFGT